MKQSGTWWTVGLALVALACLSAWLIGGPEQQADDGMAGTIVEAPEPAAPVVVQAIPVDRPRPAQPPPAEQPQPQPQAAEPQQPAAAVPAPPGTWDMFSGEMPDFMVRAHERVMSKRKLHISDQRELYKYGQAHEDDARPQLLLAYDARNREWDGIAANMYRIAFRADKRTKDDPNMLPDLLAIAGSHDRMEFDEASTLIRDAYGAEALPRVDTLIDEAGDKGDEVRVTRLNRLRELLLAK